MNVYTITNGYEGCGYVRLLLPSYHNGFNTNRSTPSAKIDDISKVKEDLRYADVVVFHRPEEKAYHDLADMLKSQGKKIVMDNDDTFKLSKHPLAKFTPEAAEVTLKSRDKSIEAFVKKSDLVTASTETLAKEYRKHNDNVIVLPNCIDPIDWDEPLRNEGKKVRIGLVGSVAFEYDYKHVKDLIRKLGARNGVQLVLFGLGNKTHRKNNPNVAKAFKDDYDFWDTIDKEHFPWCPIGDYSSVLNEARLDMMLIPRKDNYFNRCKSNVKFLEAAMCEIPVIAQSFEGGPYEEITSGENGILIKDNKDWESQIEYLIANKDARRTMGAKAKEYALDNYNIESNAHLWVDAYKKLYED